MLTAHRAAVSLDGAWLLHLPGDAESREVMIPGTWTTQVAGYGDSHETVRFEREFEVTSAPAGRLVLCFGAVNHTASVRVNGREIGTHSGAWEPFEFDITDAVSAGPNTIEVTVSYPPRFGSSSEPGFLEHPLGKQSWYGTTAGIWQSVVLEDRHPVHVRALSIRSDAATGTISLRGAAAAEAESAQVRVLRDDAVVTTAALTVQGTEVSGDIVVVDPELWDLDDPRLYTVEVSLQSAGATTDVLTRDTGFRSFRSQGGRFFLNDREIYLRAVLDQDYHPGATPAADDFAAWEDMLRQTKALGFNMLRVHIKRPDPRYYEIADRMGMLVWTELPSWMTWTPETAKAGHELLRSLIDRDGHHPSIVIWTIMNESWGIDLASATQRAWLRDVFDDIEQYAAGSLVVDNSACEPNFHLRTHIDDFHVYRGIPESRQVWDAKIADFATRPDWTFSPHGDAERTGDEPLVLSEFGNWGLPHVLDQYDDDGAEPWWFALGADWAFGAAEGTGLMARFRGLGLEDTFGSWEELVRQLHHAQLVANRYQTTSIRLHDDIRGYVLTQLSDVQWEANGLFDMNRRPKEYTAEFALANGEHAVALRPEAYSLYAGDELALTVTSLPAPVGLPADVTMRVVVNGEPVASQPAGADREEWTLRIPMPAENAQHLVEAELHVGGELLARDAADILVVARTPWAGGAVRAGDAEIAQWLGELSVPTSVDSDLLVVRSFTTEAQQHARSGGRVLLLAEADNALGAAFDYLPSARLTSRAGDGDWVPRTEWLDRRGAFAEVPGDTILGIAYEDLLGEFVISGIPGPLRSAVVHSAIFSGWLRGAATSTATVRWSEGSVTISTLRVREALQTSPIAHAVGRALLRASAGE
ncbi:glycoside hydrolase family 2 protein [Microbacterium sp. A204]|uniref:glycoside hydrolase family 2 protein n=1 Tax=Microbacterium sp. A204 TaxID=3457321 RepID=UPI003FD4A8C1